MTTPAPILIFGPTASGKSALALALAERTGGAIVNADASQVYAGWRLLTARPDAEEEALAPHRLYGHIDPSTRHSVGAWLEAVRPLLKAEAPPILVGGTGLYFKALTQGLAEIPPIPVEIRDQAAKRGPEALLSDLDAETRARIDRNNPARLRRAWEVWRATGKGMAQWGRETPPPLLPVSQARALILTPDRDALYARCDARFDAMIAAGALEEARAMLARGLDPALPAMKAVGAPELFAHLRGEMSLSAATESAKAATRRYAKRQLTWARQQTPHWPRFEDATTALSIFP